MSLQIRKAYAEKTIVEINGEKVERTTVIPFTFSGMGTEIRESDGRESKRYGSHPIDRPVTDDLTDEDAKRQASDIIDQIGGPAFAYAFDYGRDLAVREDLKRGGGITDAMVAEAVAELAANLDKPGRLALFTQRAIGMKNKAFMDAYNAL